MKPTYSIRGWVKDFETAESRKILRTRWVPIPNKHDGKTFNRIARHPRAVEIFCAWNLIVEVASKMPERGVLVDSDGPLDADDLADKTHFPVEIFEVALQVLVEPKYGWLEVNVNNSPTVAPPEHPGVVEAPPGGDGASPGYASGQSGNASGAPAQAGIEGKGIEGKGRVQASPDSPDLPFHGPNFLQEWADFEKHRTQLRKKLTPIARSRLFKQFETWGEDQTIAAIKWSLTNGWTGVFLPRLPGAGVQTPMFREAGEPAEAKQLREHCQRCRGTGTEVVPDKGARPCDHLSVGELE